ncbi:MAG: tRNA uridine-5-carboxymethylaminomethyl(34) synthesis GTPase MnmE [Gemmatimonadetes bacterium]|nr:tRNA uridine-5-carboxymethylaminomethyl(34) synthesis GTPase MnmE [Gemmatimonadota bacterium]
MRRPPRGADPAGSNRSPAARAFEPDTIAAIATPPGESGLAIVRVSGPRAVEVAARVAARSDAIRSAPTHTVHHTWLRDTNGRLVDEALLTVMRAPRTFTGEDVVELGLHGGAVCVRRTLRALLAAGARLADRGEFSKRAFLNGRIDLSRAEAIIDLIRSRTELGARSALAGIAGGVARRTEEIENRLIDVLARLELNLDFQDDVQAAGREEIARALDAAAGDVRELERRAPWGRRLRDGVTIAIVGRPNVGKSSLFNALLEEDRALVSETSGTTRDYLEAWLDLGGVPVRLVDTAGQRDAREDVEAAGVARAQRWEREADLRLVVIDASEPGSPEDAEVVVRTKGRPRVLVANKSDREVGASTSGGGEPAGGAALLVSARTGEGLDELRARLEQLVREGDREPEDLSLPNERHVESMRRAAAALDLARASWQEGATEEVVAGDVRDAISALGEVTGRVVDEVVLDRIFAQFCIGK